MIKLFKMVHLFHYISPLVMMRSFPLIFPDILQGNFKPDYYLKHIQKDLRLAISMGDTANHPTPMAAAANEVYKRAKALDQSDNDMSAVYRAYI
uniref:3-hydroxyisobutyrate dehydrogenase-like NAD-binding domain-containing protein n=1 Tax=Hucho hucho TaxID=62062 RepID=A0A4W5KTH2_9TELE